MTQTPAVAAKKSDKRMTIALILVVVTALAVALVTARTSLGAGAASREPPAAALPVLDAPPAEAANAPEGSLGGEVLETVPVSKYTYLRLRSADGEIWAAVPSARVAIGSQVTISNATRMEDFKSATLGRSFAVIYFGSLGSAANHPTDEPSGPKFPLGDESGVDPDQALPPGHPDIGGGSAPTAAMGASPHGGSGDALAAATEPPFPLPKMVRATNGRLISELVVERHELDGKRVRVRGQVTKVTPDVQGRAFFHLRDTETSSQGPATDLVVTSVATPERGQVATFEGVLRADDDIGIGFKYPVLLENATVVDQ